MYAESVEGHSVIGYVRVSTEEQGASGLGLAAQRSAIESECARREWNLLAIREDKLSGKNMKRTGLEGALTSIESGDANVLMVAKLDRLSRSLRDFVTLTERALAGGWSLVALDLGIDLSTPAGEMMANVMASMAQWERRIIAQRTRDALAVKRAQGCQLGRPDRLGREGDKASEQAAALIVTLDAQGLGYSAIARELNQMGLPTMQGGVKWYPSTIRSYLCRHRSPTAA
jgi:DNA invertase Pin-like site-specific DNA recombinase